MAKVVFPIKLEQETINRIKKVALEGNASQWVRILIEKELSKMDIMAMEKKYGSVEFKGKKYILIDDAEVTNYGTDGEVRYYAYAKDEDGKDCKVTWETKEDYDLSCELLGLENRLESIGTPNQQSEEIEVEEIEARIKELENQDVRSHYCEDGSNACDWDYPISVEEI